MWYELELLIGLVFMRKGVSLTGVDAYCSELVCLLLLWSSSLSYAMYPVLHEGVQRRKDWMTTKAEGIQAHGNRHAPLVNETIFLMKSNRIKTTSLYHKTKRHAGGQLPTHRYVSKKAHALQPRRGQNHKGCNQDKPVLFTDL